LTKEVDFNCFSANRFQEVAATILSIEEETIRIAFRRHALPPLRNCPHPSKSTLRF
jgi:hypothetical protein